MEQKPWFIYALIDPRTDEIRYIGKTQYQTVEVRFKQHLKDSARGKEYYVYRWMRILQQDGLIPQVCVLESGAGAGVDEAEKKWISWYRPWGRLTNLTDGGDGSSKLFQSEEKRRKISESWKYRVVSEETKRKQSEVRRGKVPKRGEAWRLKVSQMCIERNKQPRSLETRQKTSATMKGRKRGPFTLEHRQNISKGRIGIKMKTPRSAEARAKLSKALTGRIIKPESIAKSLETRKRNGTGGKPHTPESREKIRQAQLAAWARGRNEKAKKEQSLLA